MTSAWIAPSDALRVWNFHVDWTTPTNSYYGNAAPGTAGGPNWIIPTNDVDSEVCAGFARSCIDQPGTSVGLDAISDRLMYRLQYRNFGSYQALVSNHTVDTNSPAGRAGIHWFELRSTGADWTMHQQGTYAPDNASRWMGSIAMDSAGNMALGYSVSSDTIYPSIRYAGRLSTDPLHTLPQAETELIAGTGYQSHSASRWGDYSAMQVDPVDDCTFWYTTEYIQTSGSADWQTRVGAFKFDACGTPDFTLGVAPASQDVCVGSNATYAVTVGSISGYNSPVTLSASGNPGTAGFTVNPVTPPGASTLTISGAAAGAYNFNVVGTAAGPNVHQTPVALTVHSAAPAAPVLTAPADGATNVAAMPTFTWGAASGAVSYAIQVATDAGFTNIVASATGLTGTSWTSNVTLNTSTAYYWRVQAANACGASSYSDVFSFTTVAAPGDCGPGTTPNILFADGFEAGIGGWTSSGTGNTWAIATSNPHSGVQHVHANDPAAISDQRLASPAVALPVGQNPVVLKFWHLPNMESSGTTACYDGGILEISTDSGVTWTQVPNASLLVGPYTGAISSSFSNPLGGKQGWCGASAYFNTIADVSAYAGQTAQFRMRLGSDSSVSDTGWDVDDVTVQSCQPSGPFAAISLVKTVGTTAGVCAATSNITVAPGTTVYYCYTVTNNGNVTLNSHNLTDDVLGTIFTGLNYALTPGSSVNTVAAGLSIPYVANATTTNTATWTAQELQGLSAQATASATVTVAAAQPNINVNPLSLASTQAPDTTTQQTLNIGNTGTADLTWAVAEEPGALLLPTSVSWGIEGAEAPRQVTIGDAILSHSTLTPGQVVTPERPETPDELVTITHSLSQSIVSGNSVSCNAGGLHTNNSYLRAFDLNTFGITGALAVTQVQVGIELADGASGSQPLTVNLYTKINPAGSLTWANLLPIGTAAATVSDQSLALLTVPVAGTAPAGSVLVVEIFTPEGQTAGNSLFIGSNAAGQTAPSYLAAADCGVAEPTDVAAIGFPNMHIVMNVTGDTTGASSACTALADVPWLSEAPITGTVTAGGSIPVQVTFDSTGLAAGAYNANLCVTSNDPDAGPGNGTALVVVPVTLTVEEPSNLICNPAAITIPGSGTASGPGAPYPSAIVVAGQLTSLTDVNVHLLGMNHTWPDDLDFLVVGPQGQNLIVMSDVGSSYDLANVDLVLDDAAVASLPDSAQIVSGAYKPTNIGTGDTFPAPAPAPSAATTLATFNGTDPNGTWSLYTYDDAGGDIGNISGGWCLELSAETPVLPPNIVVAPLSLAATQPTDTTTQQTLNVGNTGEADLNWAIVEEPTAVLVAIDHDLAMKQQVESVTRNLRTPDGGTGSRSGVSDATAPTAYAALADFSEGFDDITLLPGQGWFFQNNSSPLGVTDWFQGNDTVFPAHAGAPTAYIGANYNNTSGVGTISNWMLTPEINLVNGDTISFWTRSPAGSAYPDRLELRLSTNGASTNVGALATDVGDFTTLLLSVNPSLAVGGYPGVWTQFTATLAGIPGGATGRIAFRYFVTDGGPSGNNSDYIGIDTLEYVSAGPAGPCTAPADVPWLSETPTSGVTAGSATTPVQVTFDSTGLAAGVYTANLCVTSNDPDAGPGNETELVIVPVTLTVEEGQPAMIAGFVFLDLNENGWRNADEQAGLAGVTVTLSKDGVPIATYWTNAPTGWYHFLGYGAGNYCVEYPVPAGYVPTSPTKVCFTYDGKTKIVNFGVIPARADIGDQVFFDANSNGVFDAGDYGIGNVTVALWTSSGGVPGAVVATTTTAATGTYLFANILPGEYFVQVTDTNGELTGLSLTTAGNPLGPITVVHMQTYLDADFGYNLVCSSTRGAISGRVWHDVNGDRVQDAGEAGIAGVQACAEPLSYLATRCRTTNSAGYFYMCVPKGTYLVAPLTDVAPLAEMTPTTPEFYLPVVIRPGGSFLTAFFGYK